MAVSLLAASCASTRLPRAQQVALRGDATPAHGVWLDSLELRRASRQNNAIAVGKSFSGTPIRLAKQEYRHGVGTRPTSQIAVRVNGQAKRFTAIVGIDDSQAGPSAAQFTVTADERVVAGPFAIKSGGKPKAIDVDLSGAQRLVLDTQGANLKFGHADWAGALITMQDNATEAPRVVRLPDEPLRPIADTRPGPEPKIHGPRVVGATPGRPFDFAIGATGEAPLRFAVEGLPAGLELDAATGILRGTAPKAGEYAMTLKVTGPKGADARPLKLVCGEGKLALTPPMGWNSWNCWASAVDADKVRSSADAMVASGLAAHGYRYINIDDCWQGVRNAKGEIVPNDKFPDMTALGEYIHALGLKFGIYSSPGPKTCAQFEGSWQHEAQDAKTWASWGVDYLKYDWCSYGKLFKDAPGELEKPYHVMHAALEASGRDIVYSLCQYGMGDVWKWGASVGGNLWRTTGDIEDSWESLNGIGFRQDRCSPFAGPGHWNDPDMLIVGRVGWGNPHPTNLTPNEQVLHITLWSLLASPLLIGCDMSQLDRFTLDLLCNDEVIEVDQDPLGVAAQRRSAQDGLEVWSRPLHDGTIAVGLFNRSMKGAQVTAKWADLGLQGKQPVRDLWQWKDLGNHENTFATDVPAHGAVLLRIGTPR